MALGPNGFPLYEKDLEAVKDYEFDWRAWLGADTATSHEVTVQEGIALDAHSLANGVVTAWISGGTKGNTYRVRCKVVTQGGRTDIRSIDIRVRDQ